MDKKLTILNSSKVRREITFWCCNIIVVSLLFSKFLLTLGMIGLIANAVLNPNLKIYLKKFFNNKLALAFTALFVLYLLTYFNSENLHYWAERVRIKLPFLILPFAISSLFPLPQKRFETVLAIFFFTIFLTTVYSMINFSFHFAEISNGYYSAKTMWTPKDHIRFSLAVAICVWIGIYLYRQSFFIWHKNEKFFFFSVAFLLIIYLHILSVRSGVLGFYLSAFYFVFYFLLIKKQWKYALVVCSTVVIFFWLAINFSPTLSKKINYMHYDVAHFFDGSNVSYHSDAARLMSQKMSWEVIKKNIWWGVGVGDVEDNVKNEYAVQHPEIEENQRLEPHNQFLFCWTALGLVGLILFFSPIFSIFFAGNNLKKWLFSAAYLILLSSFFTEATLETQVGTALFLFFVLLFHFQFHQKKLTA